MLTKIAESINQNYKRFPRKGGAGPGGGRYEHWEPLGDEEQAAEAVTRAIMRLLTEKVPTIVLRAFLAAKLVGIPKADGVGLRVLGCGGVVRRLLGRAPSTAYGKTIKEAVGIWQFGLKKDGNGGLYTAIQTLLATNKKQELWAWTSWMHSRG